MNEYIERTIVSDSKGAQRYHIDYMKENNYSIKRLSTGSPSRWEIVSNAKALDEAFIFIGYTETQGNIDALKGWKAETKTFGEDPVSLWAASMVESLSGDAEE